ncbi:MAG: hypothetical protein KDN19_04800 [Verrucomicrobiae bacterium]|nr:hypothetical protein [Verrucomicrobiae bacterium]
MPNAYREIGPDDVKRYWVGQLAKVHPPSPSSPGYAYDMPHYRQRLEARNCLLEKLRGGLLDERAACEALRHNIRHYRNRGNQEKVEELELELLRREAVKRGDLGAVVKLEELKRENRDELEEIIRRQCMTIEMLKRELERTRPR